MVLSTVMRVARTVRASESYAAGNGTSSVGISIQIVPDAFWVVLSRMMAPPVRCFGYDNLLIIITS